MQNVSRNGSGAGSLVGRPKLGRNGRKRSGSMRWRPLEERVVLSHYFSLIFCHPRSLGCRARTAQVWLGISRSLATFTTASMAGFSRTLGSNNANFASEFDCEQRHPRRPALAADRRSPSAMRMTNPTADPERHYSRPIVRHEHSSDYRSPSTTVLVRRSPRITRTILLHYDGNDHGPRRQLVNVTGEQHPGRVDPLATSAPTLQRDRVRFQLERTDPRSSPAAREPTVQRRHRRTVSAIKAPAIVTGPTGTGTLNVLDDNAPGNNVTLDNLSPYTDAPYEVTGLSPGPIAYGATMTNAQCLRRHGRQSTIRSRPPSSGTTAKLFNSRQRPCRHLDLRLGGQYSGTGLVDNVGV